MLLESYTPASGTWEKDLLLYILLYCLGLIDGSCTKTLVHLCCNLQTEQLYYLSSLTKVRYSVFERSKGRLRLLSLHTKHGVR